MDKFIRSSFHQRNIFGVKESAESGLGVEESLFFLLDIYPLGLQFGEGLFNLAHLVFGDQKGLPHDFDPFVGMAFGAQRFIDEVDGGLLDIVRFVAGYAIGPLSRGLEGFAMAAFQEIL
jgi:hypothetical protein